ncbi:Hypothetical predicted protein [Marmota monax]|uniref:Uncharacterized protein n=1 Tax=Marmota monax TaxID=9995 RepID=A0A5E4AAA1_MARMO|nr:hypothetical protein GHT09_000685 [Marmota monax]VTJ53836.1 Hypothetical predicted protein [Marmota monax]
MEAGQQRGTGTCRTWVEIEHGGWLTAQRHGVTDPSGLECARLQPVTAQNTGRGMSCGHSVGTAQLPPPHWKPGCRKWVVAILENLSRHLLADVADSVMGF